MMEEEMFLGLRKKSGVSKKRLKKNLAFLLSSSTVIVTELIEQGLLVPTTKKSFV